MTRTQRPPFLPLLLLVLISLSTTVASDAAQRGRKGGKAAAPAKASRATRAERSKRSSSAKETRAERRARVREERAEQKRGGGRLSKRERLALARREAEERRRRAEAARRAELARLAAIARQRALDQSLREEVATNIAKDDPTGEDPEVRRAALNAAAGHAVSVVVMDPRMGRVYTIVNQEWGVRRGFKPCSTIKLVTGLAGLAEGVIDPVAENASYGRMNLTDALAYSNNGYFQQVGRQIGFDRMTSYAHQLGLGERTGINHVGEYTGRWPVFKNEFGILRMSSHGDDIEMTPVQLATLASVFANGGTLVTPHLPRTPEEDLKFKTEVRRQLTIPQESLRRMLPGMIGAVNYGTARKSYDPTETIAGKTGTCIGAGGVWVGLFASYAPVEDPQLAIAVVGRGSDGRQHLPVAVAGQIYRALSYRFGKRQNRPPFALTPDLLAPRPKIDPSKIADTEEEDEAAADQANAPATTGTDKTNAGAQTPAGTGLQRVIMPAPQPRPTDVTTRPASKPATKTPPPVSSNQEQQPDGRPRRVLTNRP